jgi:hypothetical protein
MATKKTSPGDHPAIKVPQHRHEFKTLMLSNPNYFGTFPKLGGKVVLKQQFDTTFEQLTCLGLQPSQSRLEAVVNIKQVTGYGTDPCGTGSQEYVRFFVQQGASWIDLGVASFDVFDISGTTHPLSYCASVDFSAARKFCSAENIVNVRAILSWAIAPPAGDAGFTPVWGNVLNSRVQVAPRYFFKASIAELVADGVLTIKPEALASIDANASLTAGTQVPLTYSQLKAQYAKTDVPSSRFGFAEALAVLEKPLISAIPPAPTAAPVKAAAFTTLTAGAELAAILGAIQAPAGDTSYEQLMCAGYNPETRELEAVVEIKRNAGYSGGLCTAGSTEYVSFFAFFGGSWQSLGTATVNVHDLAAVSKGPVMYAVYRISNLTQMPCGSLTGVPLRAILSWQAQPTGPNYIPVWGNVINTHVQPQIGTTGKDEQIRLMRLGSVTVSGISNTTFLANPTGVAGDCNNANDSPFGGEIIVEGDFIPKVDVFDHVTGMVLPGAKPIIYQVWTERVDVASAPSQLTNPFGIAIWPPSAPFPPVIFSQTVQPAPGPVTGAVAGTQFYQYMESDLQAVNPRTLAAFEAGGLAEGDYQVTVQGWAWDGANYNPILPSQSKTIHVYNGYPHTELVSTLGGIIAVPMTRPEVAISLTSIPDCGNAKVNDQITGSYSVNDNFFGSVSIDLVPITVGGVIQPENTPVLSNFNAAVNQVVYDGSNTFGTSGTFTLSTARMTPCGYTLQITAVDRALVDSHCYAHWNQVGVGFCLVAK